MGMNRELAREVISDIKAALEPICAKHRLRLGRDSATFDSVSLRLTLPLNGLDADGQDASEKITWDLCCSMFQGVSPDDYGRVIPGPGGQRYKLVGIAPRSSRYPFLAEELGSHKRYKLTAWDVQEGLQRVKKAPAAGEGNSGQ